MLSLLYIMYFLKPLYPNSYLISSLCAFWEIEYINFSIEIEDYNKNNFSLFILSTKINYLDYQIISFPFQNY